MNFNDFGRMLYIQAIPDAVGAPRRVNSAHQSREVVAHPDFSRPPVDDWIGGRVSALPPGSQEGPKNPVSVGAIPVSLPSEGARIYQPIDIGVQCSTVFLTVSKNGIG